MISAKAETSRNEAARVKNCKVYTVSSQRKEWTRMDIYPRLYCRQIGQRVERDASPCLLRLLCRFHLTRGKDQFVGRHKRQQCRYMLRRRVQHKEMENALRKG